jgi:hypothetical protein
MQSATTRRYSSKLNGGFRKAIPADRHEENDDQNQRDQAIPADGYRASEYEDGDDGERQGENADVASARNTEGECGKSARARDQRQVAVRYPEERAH